MADIQLTLLLFSLVSSGQYLLKPILTTCIANILVEERVFSLIVRLLYKYILSAQL